MHLPPMMRLMIEEVRQRRPNRLLECLPARVLIRDHPVIRGQAGDKAQDPFILTLPRRPQVRKILMQDLVQPRPGRGPSPVNRRIQM